MLKNLEPRARVELATCRLRIGCSTTELPRLLIINDLFPYLKDFHQTFIVLSRFRRRVAQLSHGNARPVRSDAVLYRTAIATLASDTLPLFVECTTESRTRWKKDSKMILALSDSFRKLLSLLVLASSMGLNCL